MTDSVYIKKPHSWQALLSEMTAEMHQNLKTAIELGKWPSGDRLTTEQIDHCLQAVIAYDEHHLPAIERVAYIDRSKLAVNTSEKT